MSFTLRARSTRYLGVRVLAETVGEQLWHSKIFIGLRCDLARNPSVIQATETRITMLPEDSSTCDAFLNELPLVRGRDVVQVVLRIESCAAGVKTLYVGRDEANQPAFAQWLVSGRHQGSIHSHAPGVYDTLAEDEGLLEGAYTFVGFRGRRLMPEGMGQLLGVAKETGLRTIYTYVEIDNVPSLRGCARVGFVPDHLRISRRRLGVRRSRRFPLDDQAIADWHAAVDR